MEQDDKLPFNKVLDQLLGTADISIPQLFRLSDMQPHETAEFSTRWPETPDERRAAVTQHLADLSEENFSVEYSPVFKICLSDPFDAVRKAALDGLWDTSNTRLVTPIIEMMRTDESVLVRKTAAETLAHFVLMGEWGQIAKPVKERIVDALLTVYRDEDTPFAVKRAALEAVGSASHPDIPTLISEAYEAPQRELQMSALFAMGVSADDRWVGTLIDEMESPYHELRAEAARAAGEIADSDAVPALAELLFDEDLDVQKVAVYSLAKIETDHTKQILRNLMDDPEAAELHESIEDALSDEMTVGDIDFETDFGFDDDADFDTESDYGGDYDYDLLDEF